ncbi:hypothetical protein FQN54_004853 [Arachnomyces sp. PD_36]|nr:hypothetical protein FQN54_004853 [Arachnomyces sp. PD_36]
MNARAPSTDALLNGGMAFGRHAFSECGQEGVGAASEAPRRRRDRGSRGRGDPRNAWMKVERLRRILEEEGIARVSGPAAATSSRGTFRATVGPPRSVPSVAPASRRTVTAEGRMAPSRPASSCRGRPFPYGSRAPGRNSNPSGISRGTFRQQQPQGQPIGLTRVAVRGGGLAPSRGRGGLILNHNNHTLHVSSLNTTTTTTEETTTATMNGPFLAPWTQWDCLSVTITEVPDYISTFQVWDAFKSQGEVDSIELFENARGREGRGRVRFRPPPRTHFWLANNGTYAVPLDNGNQVVVRVTMDMKPRNGTIPSPTRPQFVYPESVELPAEFVDIGPRVEDKTLLPLRTVGAGYREHTRFFLDLYRREINIFFQLAIFDPQQAAVNYYGQLHEYRFRVPFAQLSEVLRVDDDERISLVILMDTPPSYHRRLQDFKSTFTESTATNWKAWDTWYRQTDIVHAPHELASVPINLRKMKPLINIGRWTTFRIVFSQEKLNGEKFATMCNILQDYNIEFSPGKDFKLVENPSAVPMVWKWIDAPSTQSSKVPKSSLDDLAGGDYVHLPFAVRYQLEVCISHGYLNEYTMGRDFVNALHEMEEKKAKDLLEHVASEKTVYYNPMEIFDILFVKGTTNARIPPYCCYMRSARITPSMVYYNSPSVDISNRVIRHYIEFADRFLRVRFTDEKMQGRINSTPNSSMDEVFTRIKRAMSNGITIGDRHYEFLAFGNSQFREHGAYFFSPTANVTASTIRAWMGSFADIRSIAKHAARLGQCFSTTRAVTGCPVRIREIEDIERNGHTFSDGVGRISKFLAQMAMGELKIRTPDGTPPSVFQFRLGGCKGILTVSPEVKGQEVHIRPSQYKFPAMHNGLELIRWAQFSMATLNRQIIVVLSALGVGDGVFREKLRVMMAGLELAMTSESQAIHLLQKYIDPNQMTLVLADLVTDGFQTSRDPFVTSLLELWKAWQIKYLKEKAKIVIDKGACLFGCIDETAKLKGFFEAKQPKDKATLEERMDSLPEIFVQVTRADQGGKYEVIEGLCILARNPSLHPGDIRVVKAVNVPELQHLKDVVVLPQTGDRDISSMCSGGDLDGDDYLVIWDQDLVPGPENWFRTPMDYSAPKAPVLNRPVTVNDITSFFVTYMKNDRLPQIAHAHLAFADYLEDGVDDPKCMKLSALHSAAVDYNKSGIPAVMGRELQPRKWPHFMEKRFKPKEAIYTSRKILGQLYDIVERVDFIPKLDAPFDERILDCGIEVGDDLLATATEMKKGYDEAMRRIMAQHEIKSEFEVWSTFVLNHANMSKDFKFHEELGQISSSLRDGFTQVCYEKAGGRQFDNLAPLAVAMYKVTQEQMAAALKKYRKSDGTISPDNLDHLPFISFPWLLRDTLGKIANRHYEETEEQRVRAELKVQKRQGNPKTGRQLHLIEPDVETSAGVQHSGEVLQLFQEDPDPNFDPFSSIEEEKMPDGLGGRSGSAASSSSGVLGGGHQRVPPQSTRSSSSDYQSGADLLDFAATNDELPTTVNSDSEGGNAEPNGDKTESQSQEDSYFTSKESPSPNINSEKVTEVESKATQLQEELVKLDDATPNALDQLAQLIGDDSD